MFCGGRGKPGFKHWEPEIYYVILRMKCNWMIWVKEPGLYDLENLQLLIRPDL